MSVETRIQNRENIGDSLKQQNANGINTTLKGVLVNSHLKYWNTNEKITFNDIQDSLLINNSDKYYNRQKDENKKAEFNTNKVLMPVITGTIVMLGGVFALSTWLKRASSNLLKTKNFEQLPDLAINMNIREEPQFAIYRAIRDPNFKNLLGAIGVFFMSGITLAGKNFVDGIKEIWIKKRSADIENNLQENLISVERDAFSGKLKVVNDIMNDSIKYFDKIINNQNTKEQTSFSKDTKRIQNVFEQFPLTFKANLKGTKQNTIQDENFKYMFATLGILLVGIATGKISYSNLQKTVQNAKKFTDNYTNNTLNTIESISQKTEKEDIPFIIELMKSICANEKLVRKIGKKYNLSETEIQNIIKETEESKKTIFADAPTALGGIPKKIQYYCYIDEPRGHLYNWILHPDNKFTKYIFEAFTISSAVGYTFKQGMEAIKDVLVMQENAKTELDLKQRLVSVEIENFRAKKESAIIPLLDNFTKQAVKGDKSKYELKQLADNILMEIKNGPPYIYN